MKKLTILFVIFILTFINSKVFCQQTTIKDALDFIESNLNHLVWHDHCMDSQDDFPGKFQSDDWEYLNSHDERSYEYKLISYDHCSITYLAKTLQKRKFWYKDRKSIFTDFEKIELDTVTIDFGNISKIEKVYIENWEKRIILSTYNNMNLIEVMGTINITPPLKSKNVLLSYLEKNENNTYESMQKALKKYRDKYPEFSEHSYLLNSQMIIFTENDDLMERIYNAFDFLQQNCGAPKQKF